ncbi:GNAT family N-acetyltransferase [Ammoniphilus sp. CFH 90114]|uniref:GNAT family N-acetyltransferase n=1 Tax=Ammoniphilus sp. CFH 90114 TaxID=2493665 RepID=UPI00100FBC06|nr:GNAT family N-acetyltransferase [Ammoniphilus sp. CFH 90114]RXT03677.1 GNAT family N-acetyltransferase [Ammoniphilus sp. CFH 90114]
MLSVVPINETEKWDEIVKGFEFHDIYYLSGYVRAFQINGDGEPILFFYEDNTIKAINVLMVKDISKEKNFLDKVPKNTYYSSSTPYGYGGFLIQGKVTNDSLMNLDREYNLECKKMGIVSEFVRFHPVLNNSEMVTPIYEVTNLGRTITLELNSHNEIWNCLTSQNRNKIRKAKKAGVDIFWGRKTDLFEKFRPLYNGTMDRDGAIEYYYFKNDFYSSILSDLKYNSLMFYAQYKEEIIAMSVILFVNQQMHYHLSASDKEYQHLAPTNLLLYEAASWGCENGYKTLHLGGGVGSNEDSLYTFKKGFNRNSNTYFSIGKKIFDEDKYQDLVNIRKQESGFDERNSFFPLYLA